MKWFNNSKKKLEMIRGIRPTSKATLKLQCLFVCKGDIEESAKLYDYFAKDMPDLPDFDPVQPTWVDNTKNMANGLLGWMKDNQGTLAQGYEFLRGIIQNKTLPSVTEEVIGDPLPPIN